MTRTEAQVIQDALESQHHELRKDMRDQRAADAREHRAMRDEVRVGNRALHGRIDEVDAKLDALDTRVAAIEVSRRSVWDTLRIVAACTAGVITILGVVVTIAFVLVDHLHLT